MGNEVSNNFEAPQTPELSDSHQLEATYGDLDGFSDFQNLLQDTSIQSEDPNLQKQLIALLISQKENEDLRRELDFFEGGSGFPADVVGMRYLLEKYDVTIHTQIAEENAIQAEENAIQVENRESSVENKESSREENDFQKQVREDLEIFGRNLNSLHIPGIDVISDLEDFGINTSEVGLQKYSQAEFLQKLNEFFEKKTAEYLKKAKEYSPGSFVKVYETLQVFSSSQGRIPSLLVVLTEYQTEYQTTKLALENPNFHWPRDNERVEIALGDSDISRIDGDIIYGENGEKIDFSGNDVTLSLEGENGLELEVGAVDIPDTRKQEIEIGKIEAGIDSLRGQIEQNTIILDENINNRDAESLEKPDDLDDFFDELIGAGVDAKLIERLDESGVKGKELIKTLRNYFEGMNEYLRSDIIMLEKRAVMLRIQIDTRQKLAEEKMNEKKERVRRVSSFYESLGVSRLIAGLMPVFSKVSSASTIKLSNSVEISKFDVSTLEMEGSGIMQGETGPDHQPTKKMIIELCNYYLKKAEVSLALNETGGVVFYNNVEDPIDKGEFDRKVNTFVGDPYKFTDEFRNSIFYSRNTENEIASLLGEGNPSSAPHYQQEVPQKEVA